MIIRWLIATVHLLTLPLGLAAIFARSRALYATRSADDLHRVFVADNLWGLAAALWIGTGLLRVFAGLEKGSEYYLHNHVFYAKMGLFLVVFLLEIRPMITLIRWRGALRRGVAVDTAPAVGLAHISHIQAALVVLIVFAATALARGFFN
jgi:putative membrane protein